MNLSQDLEPQLEIFRKVPKPRHAGQLELWDLGDLLVVLIIVFNLVHHRSPGESNPASIVARGTDVSLARSVGHVEEDVWLQPSQSSSVPARAVREGVGAGQARGNRRADCKTSISKNLAMPMPAVGDHSVP